MPRYIRIDMTYDENNYVRVNRVIRNLTDTVATAGLKVLLVRDTVDRLKLDLPAPPGPGTHFEGL